AEALTLQVPGDGSVRAVRDLLNALDEHSIDVADMTVHTPDLDDVFLTLTGQNKPQTGSQKQEASR
ncbi:ABC transporter, partial [Actinomadura adrarensis]